MSVLFINLLQQQKAHATKGPVTHGCDENQYPMTK